MIRKQTFQVACVMTVVITIAACATGQPQGIPPSGWLFREYTLIRGAVMCVDCSLEEAQRRYPETADLYEFSGVRGSIVFRVDWVNDAVRWRQVSFGRRLSMRAADRVLQQLTAPEYLRRPVELNTILHVERTLHIGSVAPIG